MCPCVPALSAALLGKEPQFRRIIVLTTFENKINLLHRIETFEDTEAHDQPQINKLKAWKKSNRGTKDACVTVPCRLRLLFTDSLKTQH